MKVIRLAVLLLFWPLVAFAAITVNDRGVGGNNASEASTVMSPASNLAAGSFGILCVTADNSNGSSGNFPSSVVDTAGNTWRAYPTVNSGGATNANFDRVIYTSDLPNGLTSAGSLTVTYTATAVVAKTWTFTEVVPATAGDIILIRGSANTAASATGTPTLNSVPGAIVGDFVLGLGAAESADTWTGDADTTNGSWSTMQHTGVGAGATGMSIITQWKITTTASGGQTYNPTLTSADAGLIIIVAVEADPKARYSSGDGSGSATTTLTFTRGLAASSLGVLWIAADNNGTNGASSNLPATLTDSKSNTWTLRQNPIFDNGTAGQGVEIGIYTAPITTPLVINDTVAITYTTANVAAKSSGVFEFANATAYLTGGVGTGATTGTPTVTTSDITSPDYVIGVAAVENDNTWTQDSDTTNGSWSLPVIFLGGLAGGGAGDMTYIAQYKQVNTGGAQTYNPTCTSADTDIGWIELNVPAANAATKIPTIPSIPSK